MPAVKTYSISGDFSSGCDCEKLHKEISNSGHVNDFDGIETIADNLYVLGTGIADVVGLDALIAGHDPSAVDPNKLRIESIIEKTDIDVIKRTDVTLLGLDQVAWDYSRGARTTRDYNNGTDLVVQHVYTYTMTNGNRDVASVTHTFDWYRNDGTVGLTKITNKQMTAKSLGELNREIRIGRMTDLRENAKLIGRQDIIDNLYSYYEAEIESYESIGSLDFENAVKNETDPTRRAVLDESIPQFGNLTVEQLLIWQFIGAYSWT